MTLDNVVILCLSQPLCSMFFSTVMVKHLVALGGKKLYTSSQRTVLRLGLPLFSAGLVNSSRLQSRSWAHPEYFTRPFVALCDRILACVEGRHSIYLGERPHRTENRLCSFLSPLNAGVAGGFGASQAHSPEFAMPSASCPAVCVQGTSITNPQATTFDGQNRVLLA